MTNMRVAPGHVRSLSAAGTDYVTNGFYAANRAEELAAPNLELSVPGSMEAVIDQVDAETDGLQCITGETRQPHPN